MIEPKKIVSILLIFIFIFILLVNNNFFKNTFNLIYTNYELRLQRTAYGFCDNTVNEYSKISGTGYIFYIREKFKLKKIPEIKNFYNTPDQRWIFQGLNENNKNMIIVLNNLDDNGNPKFKFDEYKVLDSYKNNCLFLEKYD